MSQNATLEAEAPTQACGDMNPPSRQHQWLDRLVGTWSSKGEANCMPGQPAMQLSGIETVRSIGGFWAHTVIESDNPEMPYTQLVTVGYDPDKEKYIATVVDSMSGYRWLAEGTVDDTGNKLTMETEGPFPFRDAPLSRFQDVTEFKSADHKVFTSSIQEEDGSWTILMKFEAKRLQ